MTGGHKDTGEYPIAVAALQRKRAEIAGIMNGRRAKPTARREPGCLTWLRNTSG
jgi:hypothetical protein